MGKRRGQEKGERRKREFPPPSLISTSASLGGKLGVGEGKGPSLHFRPREERGKMQGVREKNYNVRVILKRRAEYTV